MPPDWEFSSLFSDQDVPVVVPNRKERRERMKRQFRSQAGAIVTRKGAKGKQRKLV